MDIAQQFSAANNQDFLLSGRPLRIEDYAGSEEIKLSQNVSLTDDDVFLYSANLDILDHLDDVFSIAAYHNQVIAQKYRMKRGYYKGRHYDIIHREKKPLNKPDSRLVINLPKKLVNTFNGYFSGDPVSIKHQTDGSGDDDWNDKIQAWLTECDYSDVFSEWAKQADIYGRSYLYAYLVDGKLNFTVSSPRDTIVVYDDTVMHNPLFGIRYSTGDGEIIPTLITKDANYVLEKNDGKVSVTNADNANPEAVRKSDVHKFSQLPLIEFAEDDERTGIFDDVISLIDAIDSVLSAKTNDISSFADAYLVIKGVKLSEEQLKEIQDNRLINLYLSKKASFTNDTSIQPSAEFMTPDSNDETQENFLNRAIDLVYQISQVVNLNDSSMGMSAQAISGVALLQRYQPMQAKARTKALKMDKALRQLFGILFTDVWREPSLKVSDLAFDHKRSIPHNLAEEADIVQKMNGQVDDVTKLGLFSGIDNPEKAVQRLKDQEAEEADLAAPQLQNYLSDQKKGGGVVDNPAAGAESHPATGQSGQSNGPTK
ncbi:phage portal protein [Levilactobacillus acidifarinae]|uniref:Phage portal protein, SPP1 family n=1 Tax=Levilactobacillus acidifarinae DSM 19394 = JCM 15949 TaxID=1423715 RepID=A0A0R1LKR9_9LACO|nr:phage portal protein [Levilactobacillus acidifarinae]KRK96539.1 phage portal protein, SPP1 family [Levilactobacillus acidifarinae DSM 19394]GEO70449.1 hypothetical protein LAC03_23590 [Levilactobacillus acidifarinae]